MPMIRASIDIGSNSVLLLVAQLDPFKEFEKLSEITALGKGLDRNGVFAQQSLDDTFIALRKFVEVSGKYGVPAGEIIATATEASRVAKNAPEFYQRVKSELGLNVRIISGVGEAALTTKGILFNSKFDATEVVVMDIGGASTELIRVNTSTLKIVESISLKAGAVRATDWLLDDSFTNALSKVFQDNSSSLDRYQTKTLYCVAGTMTSLANMFLGNKTFKEDEVHGLRLQMTDIESLFKKYSSYSPEQFSEMFPFLGKRSEAIRGGLTLATHLLQRLRVSEVVISTYGLRYGTLLAGRVEDEYLA